MNCSTADYHTAEKHSLGEYEKQFYFIALTSCFICPHGVLYQAPLSTLSSCSHSRSVYIALFVCTLPPPFATQIEYWANTSLSGLGCWIVLFLHSALRKTFCIVSYSCPMFMFIYTIYWNARDHLISEKRSRVLALFILWWRRQTASFDEAVVVTRTSLRWLQKDPLCVPKSHWLAG